MTRDPFAADPPTRIRTGLIWGIVLLCVIVLGGGAFILKMGGLGPAREFIERDTAAWPSWFQQRISYEPSKARAAWNGALGEDPVAGELAKLRQLLLGIDQRLTALEKRPAATPTPQAPQTPKPPTPIKRAAAVVISHERTAEVQGDPDDWVVASGRFLPVTLQTTISSEVEGAFTMVTRKPLMDETGRIILIPQGHPVVAIYKSSNLLLGNERIPTFALRVTIHGREVELGEMPILDGTGTQGLTGEVDNHVWRLVWTSIFIEGLYAGQQVLSQSLANSGDGDSVNITGVGQHSSQVARQRLGRAQDTRPTVRIAAGELGNILVTKALRFPRNKP